MSRYEGKCPESMCFQNLLDFLKSVETTLRTSENKFYHIFHLCACFGVFGWLVRSFGWLVVLVGWLVSWLVGLVGLIGWLVGWGWLVGLLLACLLG